MKKIFQFVITVTILALFGACNLNHVFEQYQPVTNRSWDKDSVLVFTVPVKDTTSNHNIYISIRNDVRYAYSNLWLFVSIEQPGGKSVQDKFEITLADPSGKWLGEGFGGLKTREVIYRSSVFFPISGDYKIKVQQGMRDDILKGISDVGVRIEKAH